MTIKWLSLTIVSQKSQSPPTLGSSLGGLVEPHLQEAAPPSHGDGTLVQIVLKAIDYTDDEVNLTISNLKDDLQSSNTTDGSVSFLTDIEDWGLFKNSIVHCSVKRLHGCAAFFLEIYPNYFNEYVFSMLSIMEDSQK